MTSDTSDPRPSDAAPESLEPPAGAHVLLARAVTLGVQSVSAGGGPFGAVVARMQAGSLETVAEGTNQVTTRNDPTAHAEVVALRAAGAELGTFDLSGCVMLASCEPCPMCLTAGLWARVDSMWFAASRQDAAVAGFDDLAFYEAMARPREQWSVPVRQLELADGNAPFDAWARTSGKVEY